MIHAQQDTDPSDGDDQARATVTHERQGQTFGRQCAHVHADAGKLDVAIRADRAGALLAIVGVVNVPIIYFSVRWWNTLHQGASVSLSSAPKMAATMLLGMLIMGLLYGLLRNWKPRAVNSLFGKAQMLSAAGMGFMHGTNDAQKTMGIIALALAAGTGDGVLDSLPGWLSFLRVEAPSAGKDLEIAMWIKVTCAVVMAAGTAAGGWRIIKTLGHKMVRLQPVHGFAAETTDVLRHGREKLARKGCDFLVVNDVSAAGVGFNHATNAVVIMDRTGSDLEVPLTSKEEVAYQLLSKVSERF